MSRSHVRPRSSRVIHVIGVPFNSAGTVDGVALAPAALRHAGLIGALEALGLEVIDRGDLALGPIEPDRDHATGMIAPHALTAMIRAVRAQVDAAARDGALPLVLGGDCPVLLGCLPPGLAASNVGLVFVDGHEDAWPPDRSTTGEAADMELGLALGFTDAGLPESLRRELPRLSPDRLVVLGARDEAELAEAGVPSVEGRVKVVRPGEIADDPGALAAAAAEQAGRGGSLWLHLDLDVLSTESLAAVDYRQPGGLSWLQLTRLTRAVLAQPTLAGWTVTIYNPGLDPDRLGAERIVRYIRASLDPEDAID